MFGQLTTSKKKGSLLTYREIENGLRRTVTESCFSYFSWLQVERRRYLPTKVVRGPGTGSSRRVLLFLQTEVGETWKRSISGCQAESVSDANHGEVLESFAMVQEQSAGDAFVPLNFFSIHINETMPNNSVFKGKNETSGKFRSAPSTNNNWICTVSFV